jgi:hypothetical protein
MGSPTIIADISAPGGQSEITARLLDVSPGGTESLVARGLLRPDKITHGFVFQLHPQGYRFEPDHVAKLELLSSDSPYGRTSNLQQPIDVENLELRLPVLEQPGAGGGIVQDPAPVVLPPADEPAIEVVGKTTPPGTGIGATPTTARGAARLAPGKIRVTRKSVVLKLECPGTTACSGNMAANSGKRKMASGRYLVPAGTTTQIRLKLTKTGRALTEELRKAGKKNLQTQLTIADSVLPAPLILKRPAHL